MHNQQFQSNVVSQYQGFQRPYQPVGNVQSFYSQNQNQQQQYGSHPSSESYHTANYRGNQIGHDAGLRGDSFSPSQQQSFGGQGISQSSYGSSSYGVRGNAQAYSANNNVSQQFGFNNAYGGSRAIGATSSYGQSSNPSASSYHTANYRGNQMGHDAGLRGDSFSPTQQQSGYGLQQSGYSQSANYGSFSYGARGNEQAYSSVNNMSQQFGQNNAY
jgi:hypothetical protein